ncbi:Glyoxylate reductase [Halotydeus destructor]|nr:Glyoxylate reductase [Halotydeus destructor]
MACLVTRPDMPSILVDMLRSDSRVTSVDVWPETKQMPRDDLVATLARLKPQALVCTLTDTIDGPVLDAAGPGLRVVSTVSVGFDHINVAECQRRGVVVTNTPGVLTDAVAELTVALLLATARRLFQAEKQLRSGQWAAGWNHMWMTGPSVKNSTVGIIGLGRIGLAIARRLAAFEPAKIVYSGRQAKTEASGLGAHFVPLDQLLAESDFVLVCCALTDQTHHLLNGQRFGLMKSSAILINTSRGAIVDQRALVEALENNTIAAAGLDVMESEPISVQDPLMSLDNVVLLPHIGSASTETRLAMARMTAENVLAVLDGREPVGLVRV